MREYQITTDSTIDLPASMAEAKGIPVIPLSYMINGNTYQDRSGLSPKEFFEMIRQGAMPTTSQINPDQAEEVFEKILQQGKDILHIGFSSALSGSYNSARIAGESLSEKYPEAKIIVIDTLCASMGEGLLLHYAMKNQEEGFGIEANAAWIEENKLHICHNVTVDDLNHLHRGGRVSKASAVIGTMVQIKPIIHVSNKGKLVVLSKLRGRKKALNKIVEMMEEQTVTKDLDMVMITHGDCLEDAEYVRDLVKERFHVKEIVIQNIGTVIGTHTGPGVVATFFMGTNR